MKSILPIILVFVSLGLFAQKVEKVWETDSIFKVPESVLFTDTVLYVSNVYGNPSNKNGKGFISKISPDGERVLINWASGLNAPKGMGIYNGKLYVSDIDKVVAINLVDGKIVNEIEIPDSKFLNDISISDKGIVAVSDMNTQTIHFIENDKLVKSLYNEQFSYVNGLFWDGDILLAGTSGIIFKVKFDGDTPVKFIAETGGIDGLEKLDNNRFIITDWSGKMQLVSSESDPVELLNTTAIGVNAADIGFDNENNIIFIPTFSHNTVAAYKLIE